MEIQGKNAIIYDNQNNNNEIIDFDSIESQLEKELDEGLAGLDILRNEQEKIGNPDELGKIVENIIWEQFQNQIGVTAGKDFIKENHRLTLDLRKSAHIQTTENFANGKIATHNTEINYQKRYDDWQNNFQRNDDGSIKTKIDSRSGEKRAVLRVKNTTKDPNGENYNTNYDARKFIDQGRPQGSAAVHKDHTISAAEIIRDPAAAAHMTREEQADFANSNINLLDLDSSANQSKSDSTMSEWLDSESKGKSPADRFPIDEEDLRECDEKARDAYEKLKKEGEEKSIAAGKKSRRKETVRITKTALRAVLIQLLADLVREIIAQLVKWFKKEKKNFDSFIKSIKEAIKSFVSKLSTHMVNAGNTLVTTIATAIAGPVIGTINKVFIMLKQGINSVKEAVNFLKNPENQDMPTDMKVMEVGKILIAGASAAGAIVLSEVIEKGLLVVAPWLDFQIPLLGSVANIIGIFMGAITAGISGALVINLIDKVIAKKREAKNIENQIGKSNEIILTQRELYNVSVKKFSRDKENTINDMELRHMQAAQFIKEATDEIFNNEKNERINFDELDAALDDLLK